MFPCWIDFEKLIHKDIIEMFSPDVFRGILRNSQSGLRCVMPMIHVYGFSKAEDPEHDFNEVSITAATFFFYVQIPFVLNFFLPRHLVYQYLRLKLQRINVALGRTSTVFKCTGYGLLHLGNGWYVHLLFFQNQLPLHSRITLAVEFFTVLTSLCIMSANFSKQII